MYQGVAHIQEMRAGADLLAAHNAWQAWPLLGGMRPLELVLWLALVEFFLGVFLFAGLLTRVLGVAGAAVAAFQLGVVGLAGGFLNPILALGAAAVSVRGGGGGTMDAVLGAMQRRSIEREAARKRAGSRQ